MYTQKLLVHDGGEGEVAERVHDCIVDGVGVLVLAWVCQLSSRKVIRYRQLTYIRV